MNRRSLVPILRCRVWAVVLFTFCICVCTSCGKKTASSVPHDSSPVAEQPPQPPPPVPQPPPPVPQPPPPVPQPPPPPVQPPTPKPATPTAARPPADPASKKSAAKKSGSGDARGSDTPPAAAAIPNFPWPPPAASATDVLPADLLGRGRRLARLADVDTVLRAALEANGYAEKKYYAVPAGFALVTRLEQIESNGKSVIGPARWSSEGALLAGSFSIRDYMRALFTANEGHYRLIVFIVTNVPFAQSLQSITSDEAQVWLRTGLNVLPPQIGQNPYTAAVVCTALIYEFEKKAANDVTVVLPSTLDSRTHLTQSGLWKLLTTP